MADVRFKDDAVHWRNWDVRWNLDSASAYSGIKRNRQLLGQPGNDKAFSVPNKTQSKFGDF